MTARRGAMGLLAAVLSLAACLGTAAAPAVSSAPPIVSVVPGLEPEGDVETATVVRVVDGDTLVIDRGRGEERLRYIGLDAPESVRPETPVEFMGREAAAANAALVEGRTLVLERDVSDTDRFGRLLRYAWLDDGEGWRLVNLELVAQGYAQSVSFPPDVKRQELLLEAERAARDAGLGLWGPATPLP